MSLNNYSLPTSNISNFETPIVDTTSGNAMPSTEQSGGFNWDSVFNFGGQLVENSGQLASVFSDKYRNDQIALAQNQNMFSQYAPTFGATAEDRAANQKTIAIVAIALIVVVVMFFLLKNK
ncbi:hypothetical protein [Brumimicrobium aurantiacum]|uniref:Uncharacterized protein n=1 Tax=Brumimicrobium aurantiacum TaxID=1737063 RepID=A0A3E1EZ83_9FLAO|nr:hypothetical protein [Brumimicrobium aurantiacum]RFC54856.1 hypothetical protein DXU93_03280 [Brumimicrobium aurantiacum]